MAPIHVVLGDCFIGTNRAYIYLLYSKAFRVAYVGETNDANGVIGRLNAHVSSRGTFRTQLMEKRGLNLDEIDDLALFAYRLPPEPEFIGIEKAYRRGVEYQVQFHLRQVCGDLRPFLRIISNVDYSDASSLRPIQVIAENVIDEFARAYSFP